MAQVAESLPPMWENLPWALVSQLQPGQQATAGILSNEAMRCAWELSLSFKYMFIS